VSLESPSAAVAPTVPLWRNCNFWLLESGQTVSTLGTNISGLAFLLLVLALTKSPAQAGFISSLRALPFFLLAIPAGAWADRWNRKRILMLCDIGRALSLASIPIAIVLGHLTLVQLYLNALIEGSLSTFFNIASTASLPQIVAKRQLTQATSVDYVNTQTATLIGPPAGTFLYSAAQAVPFLADAISYLANVLALFWIKIDFQQRRPPRTRRLSQEMGEGIVWMWRHSLLRFIGLCSCGLYFVLATNTLIVTLLAQRQHAPEAAIGLIFSIGSIGGILGSLLANRIQQRLRFGQVIAGMFWALAVLWPLYIFAPNIWALGIITAGIFVVETIGGIVNIGYRLAITPDEFQGRVNSLHRMMGAGIGRPLGLALAGVLLQGAGTTWTILLYGFVFVGFALASTLYAPVRHAPRPD
jgi:predicted MFS family arabinose efflux permease